MNQRLSAKIYNRGQSSDFMVRIKTGHGTSIKGNIEHIQTGQVQYFNDFLELLLLMDKKLNEHGYPQSDTELRVFSDNNN